MYMCQYAMMMLPCQPSKSFQKDEAPKKFQAKRYGGERNEYEIRLLYLFLNNINVASLVKMFKQTVSKTQSSSATVGGHRQHQTSRRGKTTSGTGGSETGGSG